jgi:hypothetical protein
MDIVWIIQDNLVGKALKVSDTFPDAAHESIQAFKDALRQAFPQSGTVVASLKNQRKVKALRFYDTLSMTDPETGQRSSRVVGPTSKVLPTIPLGHPTALSRPPITGWATRPAAGIRHQSHHSRQPAYV